MENISRTDNPLAVFLNPPDYLRGTDLWMLNDRLDPGELKRQIEQMKQKGHYSFIARTYLGLKSDYPGPDFKANIAAIIEACRQTGMKVYLQACYMPGSVPDLPAEHTLLSISPAGAESPGEALETITSGNGKEYGLYYQSHFLDMLSPRAVQHYVRISYDEMWDEFRDEFGKTVLSVWVDEPYYNAKKIPWSPELPAAFQAMWGYNITSRIHLLFEPHEDARTLRYHYWRTVLKMLQSAYFTEVSRWCRSNGLLFSGHLMAEDTIVSQITQTCDCMPLYQYFDIPGIDFLTGNIGRENGYRFVNTPLQCTSAAHQTGKDQILCEMFGVSSQNLTFAAQRYIFDHFASLGINHKMVHAVFYSLRGRSKRAYPPHINHYQPYWEHYRMVNDYFARVSWFISQGRPYADTAVIHPVESGFAEYDNAAYVRGAYTARDRSFNELLQKLLGMQASFELADEESIETMGAVDEGGAFAVGRMKYRTVILPWLLALRESTMALLERFSGRGGRVIVLGDPPTLLDGRYDEDLPRRILSLPAVCHVHDMGALGGLLQGDENRPFAFGCEENPSQVIVSSRVGNDAWYYFVFNGDQDAPRNAWLSMKGRWAAELWNGEDGSVSAVDTRQDLDGTKAFLRLEAGDSVMVAFRRQAGTTAAPAAGDGRPATVYRWRGGWTLGRKDPNALVLEYARYRKAEGEFSQLYPVLAIQHKLVGEDYTGPVTLQFPFEVRDIPGDVSLVVENPERQRITVNGQPVTGKSQGYYRDRCLETLSIPGLVREGENYIELSRDFSPPRKPKITASALFEDPGGAELESVYLIGDFAVQGLIEPSYNGCLRFNRHFSIVSESGRCGHELTAAGYPFYAGTMALSRTLSIADIPGGKAVLGLGGFNGCVAEILINGSSAGRVAWMPYEIDVTGKLHAGDNEVVVLITNTLRNLLGPYHHPVGDLSDTWGGYESPDQPWMGEYDKRTKKIYENWYENREPDSSVWTDSYMQVPFGLEGITLIFTHEI